MSYIITATFDTDKDSENRVTALDDLLHESWIRLLSKDEENEAATVDIRGSFNEREALTRKLANRLIDAGVIRFSIGHSY